MWLFRLADLLVALAPEHGYFCGMGQDDKPPPRHGLSIRFGIHAPDIPGAEGNGSGTHSETETTRSQLTHDFSIEPTEAEGPSPTELLVSPTFRTLVIGQYQALPEYSTAVTEPSFTASLDRSTLEAFIAELAPSLGLHLRDPFAEGRFSEKKALRVDLLFRSLRDFRPSNLVQQVAALRGLQQAARTLERLAQGELSVAQARSELSKMLSAEHWVDALLEGVSETSPSHSETQNTSAAQAGPTRAAPPRQDRIARLLEKVDIGPVNAPAPSRDLLGRVAFGASSTGQRNPSAAQAQARAEAAFSALLEELLQHPEVHRLESAFRGLRFFLEHADKHARIEVLNVPPELAAQALTARSHKQEEPLDLIVWDHGVDASPLCLEQLSAMGELAEQLSTPVVVSGKPELLGLKSLADLSGATKSFAFEDSAATRAFRSFAHKAQARWLCVAVNGALVREPYTQESARLENQSFRQNPEHPRSACFVAPGFAVAALAARSFAEHGHPYSLIDPRTGVGALEGLSVHSVAERGETIAIPTEVLVSRETQLEVARAGLLAFSCRENRDVVLAARVPMVFREATPGGPRPASLMLADQLLVGRIVRTLKLLATSLPQEVEPTAARELALIVLKQCFVNAPPIGPEFDAKVRGGELCVEVRPRRYAGVGIEEFRFSVALGESI